MIKHEDIKLRSYFTKKVRPHEKIDNILVPVSKEMNRVRRHFVEYYTSEMYSYVSLAVTTKSSQVLCSMLSETHTLPLKKYKREQMRGLLHASQVNSWTVEYLASMKYEAQLAFKRKSSPGASGRSQPARPWSVARQEPCVKAEGLYHCVQMFSPALLPAPKHTLAHRMHKPWCKDDLTLRANT